MHRGDLSLNFSISLSLLLYLSLKLLIFFFICLFISFYLSRSPASVTFSEKLLPSRKRGRKFRLHYFTNFLRKSHLIKIYAKSKYKFFTFLHAAYYHLLSNSTNLTTKNTDELYSSFSFQIKPSKSSIC